MMATFSIGKPIDTREPTIRVDGLGAGEHRFQLEVATGDGRTSAPAVVTVTVQDAPPGRTTRPG
jgi:hypothetical protein